MTLVAYFSPTGTTKKAGEALARNLGADAFEIKAKKPYTAHDLDWTDKGSRSSLEMKDEASRPEMAEPAPDLSAYSTIYIGFPIWWGVAPRIISTFIESADMAGKELVIFATSGGSRLAPAFRDLQKKYPALDIRQGNLL